MSCWATARSARLEASAISTGRSQAVSAISMPPTTFTNTSCSCSATPAWRFAAASSIARRLASRPCATRRGAPKRMRSTSACSSISSGRPPSRVTVTMLPGAGFRGAREEDRRRVLHFLQSRAAHGEEAELVGRAEAVLGGAHDAVAAARLALEIQHGVDQVLEQPRTGDRALLGDVADDDDRAAGGLGEAHQLRGALAQLRHRPGERARRRLTARSGWSRSPAAPRGCSLASARIAASSVSRHQLQALRREPQALCAQLHLRHRFLAAGVDHRRARRPGGRRPAAGASTCRSPARRPAGSRSRPRGRHRAPGRARPRR